MHGREPLLPIQASLLTPIDFTLIDSNKTKQYAEVVTETLVNTFNVVRERQENVSNINAARRDENRSTVTFQISDSVLYFDPKSVSGLIGDERPEFPEPPDPERPTKKLQISSKWRFPWRGPHPIVSNKDICAEAHASN